MEDSANQPLMVDASLYNGQPTDTGSSCPSARLSSCTPSIQNNKDGVSVENVLDANKQWFVLRVSYGRIIKAKAFIEAKGLECYVPLRYKEVRKHGKKRIITEPLLSSFLFVYATAEQVETLLHDNNVVANESRALLSYYFDHTIHCQDNPDYNPPLTIRDKAMNNFIKLTSIKNPHIIPVTSNNIQFKIITAKPKAHAFKNEMCFPLTKTKCELKKHPNSKFECFFNDFNRTKTSLFLPFPSKLIQDNLVCVLELQE